MTNIEFRHQMSAHCESGAVQSLLRHGGLDLSEAMVFGIASGIFFGYIRTAFLPFPTIILRNKPGHIRSNLAKRLGLRFVTATFRNPDLAMQELDRLLEQGVPVGVQVDFFYMDYIPEYARAHFNAHFVVVVGKQDDHYLISDSYCPTLAPLPAATLRTARFVKGPFAPKGLMFHLESVPTNIDLASAIRQGIRSAAFYMRYIPLPFVGVRGIRMFARKVVSWPGYARDMDHLSHEIMMIHIILEERGTGGGGFRYLYAAFLQEAAKILNNPTLADLSKAMMENGDRWREISLFVARNGRSRDLGEARLKELSALILERADAEEQLFKGLSKAV